MPVPIWPDPEYVPEAELEEASSINLALREARYQDDVHLFRSLAIGKLASYDLDPRDLGIWQFYEYELEQQVGEETVSTFNGLTILVGVFPVKTNGLIKPQFQPFVKIVKSEKIEVEDGAEYLTHEVTVCEDGDAQLMVDSHPKRKKKIKGIPCTTFCFYAREKINIVNYNKLTVQFEMGRKDDRVIPFGTRDNIDDREHALKVASGLLAEIEYVEPYSQGKFYNRAKGDSAYN